jgi:membrane-bound metal-dependent hydrolase YbcI (DUF457 family)
MLLTGALLGIAPDFDYTLNWLRISWGGWHHGFTHSIPFALVIGFVVILIFREWNVRSYLVLLAPTYRTRCSTVQGAQL